MVTPLTGKTLLIGSGACARRIAEDILTQAPDLIIASTGESFGVSTTPVSIDTAEKWARVYKKTKVHSCRGTVGDFKVVLECNGEKRTAAVDRVIIAEDEKRTACFSAYGLTGTDRVMALSQLEKLLQGIPEDDSLFSGIKTVVFLVGIETESNPVILEEIMQSCLKLQAENKRKIYILTANLKVAADGLEKLYRDTRDAGVVYIKFTHTRPDIIQVSDGSVCIEFTDEVSGSRLKLPADLTIVDEKIVPSDYSADLARIFELEQDLNGFSQSDNVHRLTVLTNRRGILVAGPARSVQSLPDQFADAGNAVLSLRNIEKQPADQITDMAQIENGKCVRCLTCYRLCPYRAIQVNTRVSIAPAACERCGICLAECPRGAISFVDQKQATASEVPALEIIRPAGESFIPSIMAFCCSRSAAGAAQLAVCMGKTLPPGFQIVEVPCGGSVSLSHILTAFNSNADGVMILTCHEGNCHSEVGPGYAQQRVEQISEHFRSIGLEGDRLVQKTLASNMGVEFAGVLVEFERQLLEMGSIRLKSENK
jgi:coenzyme F420-reducing hydrogenase delta subunit/Pyruvate/2-oxoacid:ferredoxin oxidoreductase delta subunit